MRGGQLRHRIDLQQATLAADASGQLIETWATKFADVPMQVIETLGGTESRQKDQMLPSPSQRWRIRYRAGVDTTWRAVWGSTTYHIVGVSNPQGKNTELLLDVTT